MGHFIWNSEKNADKKTGVNYLASVGNKDAIGSLTPGLVWYALEENLYIFF